MRLLEKTVTFGAGPCLKCASKTLQHTAGRIGAGGSRPNAVVAKKMLEDRKIGQHPRRTKN
jgi:hypothetical protein